MEVGGEGDYIYIYTSALRWAAMRAILMIHNCEGQSHKTVSTDHNFWRERRAEADSIRGPSAYQPDALPLGQTRSPMRMSVHRPPGHQRRSRKKQWSKRTGRVWSAHRLVEWCRHLLLCPVALADGYLAVLGRCLWTQLMRWQREHVVSVPSTAGPVINDPW